MSVVNSGKAEKTRHEKPFSRVGEFVRKREPSIKIPKKCQFGNIDNRNPVHLKFKSVRAMDVDDRDCEILLEFQGNDGGLDGFRGVGALREDRAADDFQEALESQSVEDNRTALGKVMPTTSHENN